MVPSLRGEDIKGVRSGWGYRDALTRGGRRIGESGHVLRPATEFKPHWRVEALLPDKLGERNDDKAARIRGLSRTYPLEHHSLA